MHWGCRRPKPCINMLIFGATGQQDLTISPTQKKVHAHFFLNDLTRFQTDLREIRDIIIPGIVLLLSELLQFWFSGAGGPQNRKRRSSSSVFGVYHPLKPNIDEVMGQNFFADGRNFDFWLIFITIRGMVLLLNKLPQFWFSEY